MKQIPYFLKRFDLDLDTEERSIRRAYARELKLIDQETEADKFQELRGTYEAALQWARNQFADHEDADAKPISNFTEGNAKVDTNITTIQSENIADLTEAASRDSRVSTRSDEEIPFEAEDAESISEAVFLEFHKRLYAVVTQNPNCDEKLIEAELETSIHDPRMDNLDARGLFEGRIAALLLAGWKSGNEALMVVAGKSFDWVDDGRRLRRFGQVGFVLDNAFAERENFFQQSFESRESRREAIYRLRISSRPSNSDLIKMLPSIEKMVELYPHWMPIIVDLDQIQRWREWDKEIPSWRRFSIRPWLWKFNNALPRFTWITPWRIVWAILLIARAFMSSGHH